MNAIELYHNDGTATGIHYCEKCRRVARTKAEADQCCKPQLCDCGAECEKYRTVCRKCADRNEHDKERSRYATAEKVEKWDGWIFKECFGHQDGFFESVDALLEWCEVECEAIPEYAWTCTPNHFVSVNMDTITESFMDEAYEDFDTADLIGIPELEEAIKVFEKRNHEHVSYQPDYKKAVCIKEAK